MDSTPFHEASHCVAALELGLPVTYASIRPNEDEAGRTRFNTAAMGKQLGDLECAIIKIAGEVGARMAAGETTPTFNWFADGGDAEDARYFIASIDGVDELDTRHLATLRAYALLRVRWDAVEAIAAKFERNKTVLGEEIEEICRQHGVKLKGGRPISKTEALAKLTPAGRKRLAGQVAADGKRIEKAINR